jgi:transposase-like protein
MKKKQQRYTPEFRAEAVKLVTEQGLSQQEAAARLAIPSGTLGNWVAAAKGNQGDAYKIISFSCYVGGDLQFVEVSYV